LDNASDVKRRWSVIASGLLILALALVVIYTKRGAFVSPVAMVVVAAIGFAALLFQVRFRHDLTTSLSPMWLNILGVLCALFALTADLFKFSFRTLEVAAYAAIGCFGTSGVLILKALRRHSDRR
jgi:hypothetical protein